MRNIFERIRLAYTLPRGYSILYVFFTACWVLLYQEGFRILSERPFWLSFIILLAPMVSIPANLILNRPQAYNVYTCVHTAIRIMVLAYVVGVIGSSQYLNMIDVLESVIYASMMWVVYAGTEYILYVHGRDVPSAGGTPRV